MRLREAGPTLAVAVSLLLFTAALWILHRELSGIHLSDVLARLASTTPAALGLSFAFTAVSYLALTGYDALALHYVGRSLPYPRVALTSFVATAVGHNLSAAMLSGGAVRLRMYSAMGLAATEVAAVVSMVGLTFGIGVTFVAASVLAMEPAEAALLLNVPETSARGAGLSVLVMLGVYLSLGALRRRPLRLGAWPLRIPRPAAGAEQITLAAAESGLCGCGPLCSASGRRLTIVSAVPECLRAGGRRGNRQPPAGGDWRVRDRAGARPADRAEGRPAGSGSGLPPDLLLAAPHPGSIGRCPP